MAVADVALFLLTSQFHDRSSSLTLVSVQHHSLLLDLMAVAAGHIQLTRHVEGKIDDGKKWEATDIS
jgi:hypothetical protein